MVKRTAAVMTIVLALLFVPAAQAAMAWQQDTQGQQILKTYIESANYYLEQQGETPVNSLFEIYPTLAVLGITAQPDAEMPESVEITVTMTVDRLNQLQLRVSETERFPRIASALILALYGENITPEEAIRKPAERAAKAEKEPGNSYVEPVEELSGTIPRFYYAYYPNQYHDGVNWLQMTVIFPMDPEWNGKEMINGEADRKGVDPGNGASEDYEGYFSRDDYTHFEMFATPTPEPDSAAAEYDFR